MSRNTIVNEIKSQLNIVETINDYIHLDRKGKDYWGLCPFHEEKTASFSVSPDKGLYYCFGCHEHGDIFTFIQKYNGIDFKAAKSLLASRAGIPDRMMSAQDMKRLRENQRRRAREKDLVQRLQAAIDKEINRLINIEQWTYSILKTVTSERDFDRPAVEWALHTKDRVEYYLEELLRSDDDEKLEIIHGTRGWGGWPGSN